MKVKVNSNEIEFPEKTTILDYIRSNNKHIPGLCKMKELDPYGSCRLCLVEVNNRILPACSTYPRENDIIETKSNEIINSRKTALELILSDHYGDCIGPCNFGCPTKSQVQNYLALVALGKYHEAVALMKKDYILPASLGRVCPAFCERDCRRNLVEEPIAIRQLKRFAADYDLEHGPWMPEIPAETGKTIGIIGGGPAGLSLAFYARQKGHSVTIYEQMPKLGGMLRYGIPEYRLPKDILDKDIDTVIKTGIEVKTNTKIGEDITFKDLRKKHDAVYIATGAWVGSQLRIEGCDMPGVMDAIDFLRRISLGEKIELGQNVLVVGGGNSAMDVARTARRLGANVSISYRRTRNEMPAEQIEIDEAIEEGVILNELTNPVQLKGEEFVQQVELIRMELGEPDESGRCRPVECEGSNYCIDIDTVIFAVGQRPDTELLERFGLEHKVRWAAYNETTYQTNTPGVFVGGDLALGPSTVIQSIATGKEAAVMIDLYLREKLDQYEQTLSEPWNHLDDIEENSELKDIILYLKPYNHWKKVTKEDYEDRERIKRVKAKVLSPEIRSKNFDEVEETLSEEEAIKEVSRCMSCGCLDSFECKLREYSTLYGANQDAFLGELHSDPIDESHSHVILDNNKCILCGRCINLTHEITGEGLIDNLNRGFPTKNGPPVGMTLCDVKGDFIGNFVDDCPTGAFAMTTPFPKNGPWDVESFSTICKDCGIGCEMDVDVYMGFAVNISANENSWNHGLVCDKPRFSRSWEHKIINPRQKSGKTFVDITVDEVKNILAHHTKNIAIILTPEVTNDEALELKAFAEKKGYKIGAIFDEGISTTKLANIFTSKRIKLDVSVEDYPLLKPFIHIAKKNGAQIVEEDYDLTIISAPAKPEDVPTIIMHKGLNEVGLMNLGFAKIPKADTYLVIGSSDMKFKGFTISMGENEHADLILPLPAWINRAGKIVNSDNRELEVKKILDGPSIMDIIKSYF
ncbi:MAG TPA: FAD-dependent oxidoreductase [Candidatus Bathyarchaeia archaeon]|nr:FAD-dependent oxidoreductase [Candidatus Bathyarchaeia archaeon]